MNSFTSARYRLYSNRSLVLGTTPGLVTFCSRGTDFCNCFLRYPPARRLFLGLSVGKNSLVESRAGGAIGDTYIACVENISRHEFHTPNGTDHFLPLAKDGSGLEKYNDFVKVYKDFDLRFHQISRNLRCINSVQLINASL